LLGRTRRLCFPVQTQIPNPGMIKKNPDELEIMILEKAEGRVLR
jgi:hypothetical protein